MTTTSHASLPTSHAAALTLLCQRLPLAEVNWALTGSTALLLHGIPTRQVHDIDLQTDQHDWAKIQDRLNEYLTRPVRLSQTPQIRSHFGALTIHDVPIEIIGGVQHPTADGWTPPVDPRDHRRLLLWNGILTPVLDLNYEADAYEALGRTALAHQIRDWIKQKP